MPDWEKRAIVKETRTDILGRDSYLITGVVMELTK